MLADEDNLRIMHCFCCGFIQWIMLRFPFDIIGHTQDGGRNDSAPVFPIDSVRLCPVPESCTYRMIDLLQAAFDEVSSVGDCD